jgi:hypothetical protein
VEQRNQERVTDEDLLDFSIERVTNGGSGFGPPPFGEAVELGGSRETPIPATPGVQDCR